ncbi:hypothetical protein ABVT39_025101 [Epinephelus coioides]
MKSALPPPSSTSLHDFQHGDWVVIKDLRRQHWHSKRWRGPFQVFLTMHTATAGRSLSQQRNSAVDARTDNARTNDARTNELIRGRHEE